MATELKYAAAERAVASEPDNIEDHRTGALRLYPSSGRHVKVVLFEPGVFDLSCGGEKKAQSHVSRCSYLTAPGNKRRSFQFCEEMKIIAAQIVCDLQVTQISLSNCGVEVMWMALE